MKPESQRPAPSHEDDRPAPVAGSSFDLFRPVVELGRNASRVGLAVGLFVGLTTHGAAGASAVSSLGDMRSHVRDMRSHLHEFFWAHYDVEVEQKKDEKQEPEPEPEPEVVEPDPLEPALPEEPDDPYEDIDEPDPPAAAAMAPNIITRNENAAEPIADFTGFEMPTGDGTGPGYGYVASAGTATAPTYDPNARVGGQEGGTGKGPPGPPPKPRPDRSRPAGVVGGSSWSCPFPPEADQEQINRATVVLVVTVSPNGRPASVRVLSDPGYGFGRAARQCAMGRGYKTARNRDGHPIAGTTPPINVRFRR